MNPTEPDKRVDETEAQRWLRENRPAMDAWNDYIKRQGLPLNEFFAASPLRGADVPFERLPGGVRDPNL